MKVLKETHLPRNSNLRRQKCHACQAESRGTTTVLVRRQGSADICKGPESTTPATQKAAARQPQSIAKAPLTSTKARKYHTCTQIEPEAPKVPHLDVYKGLESTTPATQIEPAAPKVPRRLPRKKPRRHNSPIIRCQGSADIYKGLESTTPATQIEPEVPKVPHLPRRKPRNHNSPSSSPRFRGQLLTKVSKVPHLPHKSSLRRRWYHACHAESRGATTVLARFGGHLQRA